MKKAVSVLLATVIILSLAACSCVNYATPFETTDTPANEIELVKDASYFDEFEIDEDRDVVNFTCSLTLKNTSDNEVRFYLVGDFNDSYENKLITERYLRGVNFEDKNERLVLKGNQKKTFTYVFKGEHSTRDKKPNRSLPEIQMYKLS